MEKRENMNAVRRRKSAHKWVRAAIQIFFFIFFPSVFTSAFSGVKYIFTQLGTGQPVEWTSFLSALVTICLFTIVFGRFFCGYACAFGSPGDALHGLYTIWCRKRKKRPWKMKDKTAAVLPVLRYFILAAIVLLCFAGVYSRLQGSSPWDVFSMLQALRPKAKGYIAGWIILLGLLACMFFSERFFCRFICPMGAVFSLIPVLPVFSLHRDRETCLKECSACSRICPSDIELPQCGTAEVRGDCFQCGKCIDVCPKGNISTGIRRLKGNEIWFAILRAAALAALCVWLGI